MPNANTVYNSSGTAYAAGTGLANAGDYCPVALSVNSPAGPDVAGLFGLSGTFTSAVVAFEQQLVSGGAWLPLRVVNEVTGQPSGAGTLALTDSTGHLFRAPNLAGAFAARVRLVSIGSGSVAALGQTFPASQVAPPGSHTSFFSGTSFASPALTNATLSGTTLDRSTSTVAQGAPTAEINTSQTYTAAKVLTGIITSTQTAAVTGTLDTGTNMDAILSGIANGDAVDWTLINLGTSSGAVTLTAATGHTIVGSATVAIGTSAQLRSRKTGTATWVTYRMA